MNRSATIALMIASSLQAGCAAQGRGPEAVPLDRAVCARCSMLISSERGGGQIVSASEDTRFYDDIGCLAADWAVRPGAGRPFVRTADGQWIDARRASYALPIDSRTPMGSGFAAFATADGAQAADGGGHARSFDDIIHPRGAGQ